MSKADERRRRTRDLIDTTRYERGEHFAANRKSLRYIAREFCPDDGRLIAAIVVYETEKYLWTIGGRIGSHAGLARELEELIADTHDDHERYRTNLNAAETDEEQGKWWQAMESAQDTIISVQESLDRLRASRRPAVEPHAAIPVTDAPSDGRLALAACPGCSRRFGVTLSGDSLSAHRL